MASFYYSAVDEDAYLAIIASKEEDILGLEEENDDLERQLEECEASTCSLQLIMTTEVV